MAWIEILLLLLLRVLDVKVLHLGDEVALLFAQIGLTNMRVILLDEEWLPIN